VDVRARALRVFTVEMPPPLLRTPAAGATLSCRG